MKKILFIYLISILFLNPSKANFEIKASTAILQDFLSKKILYEKNSEQLESIHIKTLSLRQLP